jgi:AcrR family transcriptional regulator
MADSEPGLRERKGERTREAIERAAFELTQAQGFEHTTVEQIAARADVAPRTVFSRYPTKDAIVFSSDPSGLELFRDWLEGEEGTIVQRITLSVQRLATGTGGRFEVERMRMEVMLSDPYLRRGLRGRLDIAESLIAARLSQELDLPADDAVARVAAAAICGLFLVIAEKALAHQADVAQTERAVAFLAAGLGASGVLPEAP